MARLPRLTLPGLAHHLIQRGNNRDLIFRSPADHETMKSLLAENSNNYGVAIHAYVLMANHFHLLATPRDDKALPQMMQAVGRSYVRYFNNLHGRTGTLWEGRYRSTVIEAEKYLLMCMAYMDLNPVRQGLADEPADYEWSSYRHYAGVKADRIITPHALFWDLANTPFGRESAYVETVRAGVSGAHTAALTRSAMSGWALGDEAFIAQLQQKTQRRVHMVKAGRPRGTSKAPA